MSAKAKPWRLYIVHGGPMLNSSYMVQPLEQLAGKFKLVFIDLPGRGKTPYPGDSLNNFYHDVQYIDSIRKSLGDEKINILGHSWGGFVAMAYAKLFSGHVNKAVIVSAPVNVNDSVWAIRQAGLLKKLRVDTIKNKYDNLKLLKYLNIYDTNLVKKEFLRSFEISMLNHDTAKYFKKMDRIYNETIEENWNQVFHSSVLNISPGLFSELKSIKFLLIYGKYDNVAFLDRQPNYLGVINVTKLIFDKSSHNPFYEQNELFIKEVIKFLTD